MTDRPILMSGGMVRATLADLKTKTRRAMKPQPCDYTPGPNVHAAKHPTAYFDAYCGGRKTDLNPRGMTQHWCWWTPDNRQGPDWIKCPYGVPGDRLWVKETFKPHSTFADLKPSEIPDSKIFYRADNSYAPINTKWWPSLFMQRRFSRILLEIVSIRAERLHDITEADAEAEGVREPSLGDPHVISPQFVGQIARAAAPPLVLWQFLWRSINGDASWDANPWVWVVEFKRVQP